MKLESVFKNNVSTLMASDFWRASSWSGNATIRKHTNDQDLLIGAHTSIWDCTNSFVGQAIAVPSWIVWCQSTCHCSLQLCSNTRPKMLHNFSGSTFSTAHCSFHITFPLSSCLCASKMQVVPRLSQCIGTDSIDDSGSE